MSARRDLLRRYRDVWRHAWRHRRQMAGPSRTRHEAQFLPAALALQEMPVHPLPRVTQWVIMLSVALALLWACLGEIDVVASAGGKILPGGRSKVIQSSEVAVIRAIHIQDGQTVRAGDLLIELDTSMTGADVRRLNSDLLAADIDIARAGAMLESIDDQRPPPSLDGRLPAASPAQREAAGRWLHGQYLELRSQLEQHGAEIEQREAEITATRQRVANLKEALPISRRLAADYRRLLDKGYVARHAWMEKEQQRLEQERELTAGQARLTELAAARRGAETRRQGVLAQTRRAMLDMQQQASQRAAALRQELAKAQQRHHLMSLTAPVDGTVQQLAVHTTGGVVTEAQPLMVIVPRDQPLEVEALLENKDIGFVFPGQAVEVKVETFTFTRYGVINGTVSSLSGDAIEDEKRGLVYSVRILLEKNSVRVGDRDIPLSPGMAVRAEVKTDRRKVIDYFLGPLKQYVSESLEER